MFDLFEGLILLADVAEASDVSFDSFYRSSTVSAMNWLWSTWSVWRSDNTRAHEHDQHLFQLLHLASDYSLIRINEPFRPLMRLHIYVKSGNARLDAFL